MSKKIIKRILTATAILILASGVIFAQTRVAFKRGQSSAIITGTLAAGATRSFIVRGRSGQSLSVVVNNAKIAINLRRGKADTTEDFDDNLAGMTADLLENGDFVFELSNQSKRAVKFRMTIEIE